MLDDIISLTEEKVPSVISIADDGKLISHWGGGLYVLRRNERLYMELVTMRFSPPKIVL